MKKRVGLLALGCKVNRYESDAYAAMFVKHGYEIAPFDGVCDIYVINTCSVTNLGDRKSRQMIRRAKAKNPNAIVVATGCYVQTSYEKVRAMDEVDLCIGTAMRSKIVEMTETVMAGGDVDAYTNVMRKTDYEELEAESVTERTRAYIKIEDGCDNFCSYCIIPYARGPVKSRQYVSIIKEAERLARLGYKEVVLTGISVAFYGKDIKTHRLIDVIEGVCAVDKIERVRISSIDPRAFTDEFIARLGAQKKVCRHFHISLQSGSAEVLKAMNRHYTPEEYMTILNKIRAAMPDASITTDIIEGFPTETEENFEETKQFVKTAGFLKVHVFPYSERHGTVAAEMAQLPMPLREERARELGKICDALSEELEKTFLGGRVEILFEKRKGDFNEGLSKNYLRVFVPYEEELTGQTRTVEITSCEGGKLFGRIAGEH